MERRRWRSDVSRGSPYKPGSATWPLPLGKTASQVVRWLLYRVCDRKEIIRALAYHRPIADVEAEDLDFGDSRRADEALAFAVDGNIDAEALESDDETDGNDELGIEAEEADSGSMVPSLFRSRC